MIDMQHALYVVEVMPVTLLNRLRRYLRIRRECDTDLMAVDVDEMKAEGRLEH